MESNEYEYGILWMDLQHSKLIEWFNKLHNAFEEGTYTLELLQISKFMEWYVMDHFEMEEAYMQKYGYPEYEQHKKLHLEFSSDYSKFTQTMLKNEMQVGSELLLMLYDFITRHIADEDGKYAEFLKKNGVK